MRIRYIIFVFVIISLMLCCFAGLTASAELTSEDITVEIRNAGVKLAGEDYEPTTIGEIDYYEFDYIDGMVLSFVGGFSSTPYVYVSTQVLTGGILHSNYVINNAGIYELIITVNYTEGGTAKQVEKTIHLTVNKVNIDIDFVKTQKYYKDGSGGATAQYINKPASVLNSSLKLAYYEDEALTTPIGMPENAGTYYVKAFYQDSNNPNYTAEEVSAFIIHKSEAIIDANDNVIATFLGEEFDVLELISADIVGDIIDAQLILEVFDGEDWVEDSIIDAGTYEIRMRFEGDAANYEYPISDEYTFTVQKADIDLDIDTTISFEYSVSAVNILDLVGDQILLFNAHNAESIAEGYGDVSVEYYNMSDVLISAPSDIGEYKFVIYFAENANYNAVNSEHVVFKINRIAIIFEYEGVYDPVQHMVTETYTGDEIEIIYILTDALAETIDQPVIDEEIIYSRVIKNGGGIQYEVITGLPVMPGEYRVQIEVTTEHYYGNTTVTLYIEYLTLPVDIIVYYGEDEYDNSDIDYIAAPIIFTPSVDESYDIDGFIIEFEGIEDTDYTRTATPPQHAGSYRVYISLDDDLYQKNIQFDFSVLPLMITVKPNDLTVVYGERLYLVSGTLVYRAQDITITGLAEGDTANSILPYITILIGDNELTQTDATITVGEHDLTVEIRTDISSHPSYIIDVSEQGTLLVNKRNLFVKMNDAAITIGQSFSASINEITGYAYSDSSDTTIQEAIQWYYKLNDDVFETLPSTAGVYAIVATGELDNYIINSIDGTLTISGGILVDTNGLAFSLKGKFAPDQSVKIVYGNITNDIRTAVSDNFGSHQAIRVYELKEKAVTVDGSKFIVYLDVSDLNREGNFKVLAKYGNIYTKLEFAENGNIIEISDQIVLADMYILCSITKFNWLWIILIGSIVLIIGAIVGVILRIYMTGGFKKKFEEEAKVVKVKRQKNEDDEFDELLQSFDESTVVKEMTPAERLALKKKEEKYEQYRLKLQRLRSTGDKTLEDSLRESGITQINDEILIEKMIQEDEERMRRIEEEARLEKEALEKEKEKPVAVILPKNTESYEQKSFAPKLKDDDDDFDI